MPDLTHKTPANLADALVLAVRDVRPTAARMDSATIALELDRHLNHYWGEGHGISLNEMLATARDLKAHIEAN